MELKPFWQDLPQLSLSIGEPSDEFLQIFEVSKRCFERGTASMTVGTLFRDVIEAYRGPADEAGMAYVELGVHGHGLTSCGASHYGLRRKGRDPS